MNDFNRVLFFCAHTDDEMVCAGTLHKFAQAGAKVEVVAFGSAGTKKDSSGGVDSWDVLKAEFERSMQAIGAIGHYGHLTSINLHEQSQRIADAVFSWCSLTLPDLVITLSPEDENPAHAVVGAQVRRVTRGRVKHHWEVQFPWNHSIGRPNIFIELSPENVEAKRSVIRAYESQKHRYDYERLLMAQTVADGEAVKVRAAEKFELIRSVWS